jgi:D-alanine--poly(phosphoribitol) ligase subunit 1
VAFSAERAVPLDEVRDHCAARLPTYMQPARLTQIDTLPQNANGKIDRKAIARLLQDAP